MARQRFTVQRRTAGKQVVLQPGVYRLRKTVRLRPGVALVGAVDGGRRPVLLAETEPCLAGTGGRNIVCPRCGRLLVSGLGEGDVSGVTVRCVCGFEVSL